MDWNRFVFAKPGFADSEEARTNVRWMPLQQRHPTNNSFVSNMCCKPPVPVKVGPGLSEGFKSAISKPTSFQVPVRSASGVSSNSLLRSQRSLASSSKESSIGVPKIEGSLTDRAEDFFGKENRPKKFQSERQGTSKPFRIFEEPRPKIVKPSHSIKLIAPSVKVLSPSLNPVSLATEHQETGVGLVRNQFESLEDSYEFSDSKDSSLSLNISDEMPTNFAMSEIRQKKFDEKQSTFETSFPSDYNVSCLNKLELIRPCPQSQVSPSWESSSSPNSIPALFFPSTGINSSKVIVFLHANSEDLVTIKPFMRLLNQRLKVNILAPEYPGYSFYKDQEPSEKRIIGELFLFLQSIQNNMGFELKNVILMGRSIGCSFALSLAKQIQVNSVVLISPFFDLKSVVKELFGSFAQVFVKQSFSNHQSIEKVKSPLLLIHGSDDTMIKLEQAKMLFERTQDCFAVLYEVLGMGHNVKCVQLELLIPFYEFFAFLNAAGYPSIKI